MKYIGRVTKQMLYPEVGWVAEIEKQLDDEMNAADEQSETYTTHRRIGYGKNEVSVDECTDGDLHAYEAPPY